MEPCATRDRLTNGVFVPLDLNKPLGRFENALPKMVVAEATENKIRQVSKRGEIAGQNALTLAAAVAAEIISKTEQELITAAEAARHEVIRVDDFPQEA